MKLSINDKEFTGLIDTEANVTIISKQDWHPNWPLILSITNLQGIGQSQNPMLSSSSLIWHTEEGKTGLLLPYVLSGLPVNLCVPTFYHKWIWSS